MSTNILIIEDNQDLRENTAEILELAGYNVHTAENGKVGVTIARDIYPDIIICDIMMPELDGYGVLKMLSKTPDTASIPFIFLTAKADKNDFRKGMNLGADDYLTKPFDDTDLLDVIEVRLQKLNRLRKDFGYDLKGYDDFVDAASQSGNLDDLVSKREPRDFRRKEIVYRSGDHAAFIYLLTSGKLKSFTEDSHGKEYITELISEGDYFGYNDVLMQSERTENIGVLEDAEIIQIPKEEFEKLLLQNKDVSSRFIRLLAGNIKEKEDRLLRLAFQSVRMRVRDALLMLRDKFKKEDSDYLTMSIARDDLAAIVGTSSETIIRTLSDFKSEGLIEVQRSQISITNEAGLENLRF